MVGLCGSHLQRDGSNVQVDPYPACKRGSLQLYASQPSRTKPLYQDNILLVSKEDGHDVKQLNDEEQHMATDLSGGWI